MMKTGKYILLISVCFSAGIQIALMGSPWPPRPDAQRDPYPYTQPWPPVLVPEGCDKLLSRGCKVTSSEDDPIIGELSYITDGVKEYDMANYVELSPGLQWVQIDLGEEMEIHAICIWHFGDLRVYRDVVVQISNNAEFGDGVVTVFNNDHDNSSGLGKGKDKEFISGAYGRPFAVDAVRGRYVRCYSRGNTSNLLNHYTEVEVYGRPIDREQEEVGKTGELPPVETDKPTSPKTTPWKILLLVNVIVVGGIVTASRYFRRKRT